MEEIQISMSKNDAIFFRNKKRALRNALGRDVGWTPEHERLNTTPVVAVDASEDFMNEKRKRGPIGSRKPPAPIGGGRTRLVQPNQGEQAWLAQGRPQQAPEKSYSHGEVAYDDVPLPPPRFEHTHKALGVDLSGVLPGEYCMVYDNQVWSSINADEIEFAIEQIMRDDPNVQDEDIIVMHRLNIKVGVFIG